MYIERVCSVLHCSQLKLHSMFVPPCNHIFYRHPMNMFIAYERVFLLYSPKCTLQLITKMEKLYHVFQFLMDLVVKLRVVQLDLQKSIR